MVYRWDSDNKSFIEVHEEIEIVKQIFQMYLDGFSMRQISKFLKNENTNRTHLIPEKNLAIPQFDIIFTIVFMQELKDGVTSLKNLKLNQ